MCSLEYQILYRAQYVSNSEWYIPVPKPYRICMKITVFWNVTACSRYAPVYQTTRRQIPVFKWKQNGVTYEASSLEEHGLLETLSSIITIVVFVLLFLFLLSFP
jgi:hypothetical protein